MYSRSRGFISFGFRLNFKRNTFSNSDSNLINNRRLEKPLLQVEATDIILYTDHKTDIDNVDTHRQTHTPQTDTM